MRWQGPIVTDSGGFQVFSMGHGTVADEIKGRSSGRRPAEAGAVLAIEEEGVRFRSYVDALQQIIPFGGVVVMLFAFALDSDRMLLHQAAPGLFWAAVLLAVVLAVGRSFAIEEANRARDGLRLSGLDGGSIFLGKAAAVAVELFLLEVIVGAAVVVLYDVSVRGVVVLLCAAVAATVGLAATGTVYGVLAGGLRARETLVPLLVLPAVTPVMLGATPPSRIV